MIMSTDCTSRIQTKRGFTLIEMMVAIFLFSVVMVIATGALVSILGADRKAQAVEAVMNNLNFALDSMTRAIRTGSHYDCGFSPCNGGGSTKFTFVDTDGQTVIYRYNAGTKRIERSINAGAFQPLTSPSITVTNLRFSAIGENGSDTIQPRVLITVQGTAGEGKAATDFNLEMLATQRVFDR